jgi:hypothetical protein
MACRRRQVRTFRAESIALIRNLSPRLKALLTRVRSGEVSPHAFETECRMTYLTRLA